MPTVIPVRMHFSSQDLWFSPGKSGAVKGDHVVVSTERGTEFGLATDDPFEAPKSELKGELKPVIRIAGDADLEKADRLARKGEEAMPVFRALVKELGLDMKPVGVEFLFGGEKAVFYFAAEDRIDFRDLVHDLASTFHQRVDMRQIGVRDEARFVGGYAPCGQELCCVRLGGQFEPVSIRMAKEQDLPLNSAKISGVCGRLMCCLRYEFEAYKDFKQRAPKKNALIDTPLGKAKIVEYNTPRELVTMRLENGKSFTVALKDMTASEGCCKRSAENKSPLRPDTVTREALEAIGTPEIILQLAELDRANNPDAYALDDSLVSSERRTTRRRGSRQAAETVARTEQQPRRRNRRSEDADVDTAVPTREPRRRTARAETPSTDTTAGSKRTRRSGRPGEGDSAEPQAKQPTKRHEQPRKQQGGPRAQTRAENDDQPTGRQTRRRHTHAPQNAAPNSTETPGTPETKPGAPRKRTHKTRNAEGARADQGAASANGTGPDTAQKGADHRERPDGARRRRRPGDRGGE